MIKSYRFEMDADKNLQRYLDHKIFTENQD